MIRNSVPADAQTMVVDGRSWRIASVEGLVREIDSLQAGCHRAEHAGLFRGQADVSWGVNSTFARGVQAAHPDGFDATTSFEVHQGLLDCFGERGIVPSQELLKKCSEGMDSCFELMKRMQQHPEEFKTWEGMHGTPLLDWSKQATVAACFAVTDHKDKDGVVYVADATEAGEVLASRSLLEALDAMQKQVSAGSLSAGPMWFCPARQIGYLRATRQDAYYLLQVDQRVSVDAIWARQEKERGDAGLLFRRLIIPAGLKPACKDWLAQQGVTRDWLLGISDRRAH